MRITSGLLCILLLAVGCSEKDNVPSGVIGKEQMGDIIWDMMQADQYAANYLIKDSSKVNVKMETLKLYEEVFRLHKVTRDEFRKSFQFYQDHPDITRTLFDTLIARGNRLRSDSYTHPPAVTPASAAPVVKPPMGGPNRPSGILPNRPMMAPGARPGRPAETLPNRPPAILPNQQRGKTLPGKLLKAGEVRH